jgi:hypothetical protein
MQLYALNGLAQVGLEEQGAPSVEAKRQQQYPDALDAVPVSSLCASVDAVHVVGVVVPGLELRSGGGV